MSDLLSSLTAERLDELAKNCDNIADQREAQAVVKTEWRHDDLASLLFAEAAEQRQIAAVLRALAKAERAMRADDTLSVQHGDVGEPPMPGFIAARDDIRIPRFGPLHPTLLAALGSVGQQEKL